MDLQVVCALSRYITTHKECTYCEFSSTLIYSFCIFYNWNLDYEKDPKQNSFCLKRFLIAYQNEADVAGLTVQQGSYTHMRLAA